MRYVLLVRGSETVSVAGAHASLRELNGQVAFFSQLAGELRAGGELIAEQALAGPEHSRWVPARGQRRDRDQRPAEPPVEQFLVAYWVVDCDGPERAMEIAKRVSAGPGFSVEVRPVLRRSGEEM
jgi:hypothetical protein